MNIDDAEPYLRHVTGRGSTRDALKWLHEGRTLPAPMRVRELLAALVAVADHSNAALADLGNRALREVCRDRLRSDVDTGTGLLAIDTVPRPQHFRQALDEVASHTASRTLRDISVAAVAAAQTNDPSVMNALCAVAGLTYSELKLRAHPTKLPGKPCGHWTNEQYGTAFAVIDSIIQGTHTEENPARIALRPVELLLPPSDATDGWEQVERMRAGGVPYEMLLTQRWVGSAWGAHRNRISQKVQDAVATVLCGMLDSRLISYRLLDKTAASKTLLASLSVPEQDSSGSSDPSSEEDRSSVSGQVKVIVRPGKALYAVAVSVAKDHGTANKSGGKLLQLPGKLRVPAAAVLAGPGWAARGESVDLVRAFEGRVYTELTMSELVEDIVSAGQDRTTNSVGGEVQTNPRSAQHPAPNEHDTQESD